MSSSLVLSNGERRWRIEVRGGSVEVDGQSAAVSSIGPGAYRVDIDGRATLAWTLVDGSGVWVHAGGRVFHFTNDQATPRARSGTSGHGLGAPMPATVRAVLVDVGAKVHAGDTVVTLEAMKMELSLRAPSDGTVTAINCRVGELVEAGVPLVEIT